MMGLLIGRSRGWRLFDLWCGCFFCNLSFWRLLCVWSLHVAVLLLMVVLLSCMMLIYWLGTGSSWMELARGSLVSQSRDCWSHGLFGLG